MKEIDQHRPRDGKRQLRSALSLSPPLQCQRPTALFFRSPPRSLIPPPPFLPFSSFHSLLTRRSFSHCRAHDDLRVADDSQLNSSLNATEERRPKRSPLSAGNVDAGGRGLATRLASAMGALAFLVCPSPQSAAFFWAPLGAGNDVFPHSPIVIGHEREEGVPLFS